MSVPRVRRSLGVAARMVRTAAIVPAVPVDGCFAKPVAAFGIRPAASAGTTPDPSDGHVRALFRAELRTNS